MIYYFSGTGNSEWIAKQLAAATKDSAFFIPQIMKERPGDINVAEGDVFGIVFPVYAWAPPAIVMKFLEHVHVDKKAYSFAVCTCGGEAGKSIEDLRSILPLKSGYSIKMPDNYIPMFDVDDSDLVREKIGIARQKLPIIARNILSRKIIFDVEEGSFSSLKSAAINPLFKMFAMNSKKFSADSTCTGCGKCAAECPFGVIKLDANRPVWNTGCQMCMRCIMHCPVKAIQYGNATRTRGRYVFVEQAVQTGLRVIRGDEESTVEQDAHRNDVVFIAGATVRTLSNPGVVSRQLLNTENAPDSAVTVSEIHLMPGASLPVEAALCEEVWCALKGRGRLLFTDGTEKDFCSGDTVRFAENTGRGFRNSAADEFVFMRILKNNIA